MLQYYLSVIQSEEEKISFSKIYELYKDSLYRYALGIVKSPTDAEDALHNAFCNIIKALPAPEDVHSKEVKNYLYVTVNHCCIDLLRERKKHNMEVSVELLPDILSDCTLLDEQFFVNDTYKQVVEKLKSLPVEVSAPFTLYHFNNFSYTQISNLLNISEVAARKRVSRIKKIIKESVTNGENDDEE